MEIEELIAETINTLGKDLSPETKVTFAKAIKHNLETGCSVAESLGLNSDNMEWIYTGAYNFYKAGRYNDAILLFKLLIRLDEDNVKYYLGLGACFFMLKQYDVAIYPYAAAAYFDKDNPIPFFYISECFLKMNDKASALRTYDKMLEILNKTTLYAELKHRTELSAEQLRKETQATVS